MKALATVMAVSLFVLFGCDAIEGSSGVPKLYDPALIDTESGTSTDTDSNSDSASDTGSDADSDTSSSTDSDTNT